MIEIDIPTIDPLQHEPKVFVGMSSRQLLCIVPGVAIGAGIFMLTKRISLEFGVLALIAAVIPAVCLGWIKPYNMKFEEYVRLVYYNTFVASPKRIYKTDNADGAKQLTIKERQAKEKKEQAAALAAKKASKTNKEKQKGKGK